MKRIYTSIGYTVLLLSVCLVFSCSRSSHKPKLTTDHLSIIAPHTSDIRDNFIPLFKEWYKKQKNHEIEVEWINQGGTSDDLRFIRSEFARTPKSIGIDLFWGGGISPYFTLKKEGLLKKTNLDPVIINRIPSHISGLPLYDPDKMWYGSCLSTFGIIVNKMVAKYKNFKPIKTWEDLAKSDVFGWVGAADPRHSGSNHVAFDIILQAYGWDRGWRILTLMAANMKRFNISSKDVVKDLISGDVAYSLSVDYYGWKEIDDLGPKNIAFVMPEGVSIVNPDCFAILKGAPHYEQAKMFMEYVLSDLGQKVWMQKAKTPGGPPLSTLSRLSIVPNIYNQVKGETMITINPFKIKTFINYDANLADQLWNIINDLYGTMLVDNHSELSKTWKFIIDHGKNKSAIKILCSVPISFDDAIKLSSRWGDEKLRNKTINLWHKFTQQKYRRAKVIAK